ncbi:MAG TPA: BrnT family toxin [Longimicrobium sp.]|nr:BrnT family toxin [Longimicrobium sp.]
MHYEWDAAKAASNLAKHRISFAEATSVFQDEQAMIVADPYPDEERYVTIGMDASAKLLVVVFTWRGPDRVRLISARRATRWEHRVYAREVS